jgi:hypothetical protein
LRCDVVNDQADGGRSSRVGVDVKPALVEPAAPLAARPALDHPDDR